MDLERLINGAVLGTLVGLGLSATAETATAVRQKHLEGYDNLQGDAANLAFQLQAEWGADATQRLLRRMDTLAALAAVMEAGPDTDMEVLLATADRAHYIHDRIGAHINTLLGEGEDTNNKATLVLVQEWAKSHATNIDTLVRQRGGVTAPPVPCEYNDAPAAPEPPKPAPQGGGLSNMMSRLLTSMLKY